MKNRVVKRSILVAIIMIFVITAKESEKWVGEKVEVLHEGNFALPTSQQPTPLLSFGQNIVEKHDLLGFTYYSQLKGPLSNFIAVVPSILYGLTDTASLFVQLPIAVKFKHEDSISHGVSDLVVELEQVIYAKETETSVNEIDVVGHVRFPTGSASKQPSTGFGSPTFFLGVSLSRTTIDWYYFSSLGGTITTFHKNNKVGNLFLYQCGVGKNIAYKTDGWILNWLVELNGTYVQRGRICNVVDCSSGGNTVILGPSLFFSTRRFEMNGGIAAVVSQHLFGRQTRDRFLASFYAGWKF